MTLNYHPTPHAIPKNATGILILPGGGYTHLSLEKEGLVPAQWLNARGYDAWVLSYSTANPDTPVSVTSTVIYPTATVTTISKAKPLFPKPQEEALDAVRRIREEFGGDGGGEVRIKRLGIWGFSAGGHLAAYTLTTPSSPTNPEPLLDFGILAYPVITMTLPQTHTGSREALLGSNPPEELVSQTSVENRVSETTPPVFLFHTSNDGAVPVGNSLAFAAKMAEKGRKFGFYVLPDGPHGAGMGVAEEYGGLYWGVELERWLESLV